MFKMYREIGESDWEYCTDDQYTYFSKSPEHDVKLVDRKPWDGKEELRTGHVVYYDYCRGNSKTGFAEMRGRYGYEFWMKTLEGDNHFGTRNFVVTIDVELFAVSNEDFKRVYYK
tara:strand:- start:42934 stop:43278 length:345 start_codon:yes stop_codon:yes gene_type:complete